MQTILVNLYDSYPFIDKTCCHVHLSLTTVVYRIPTESLLMDRCIHARSCKTLQVKDQNEGYFEDGRGSDSRVLRASNDYLTLLGKCHHMSECVVYSALVSSTEGL